MLTVTVERLEPPVSAPVPAIDERSVAARYFWPDAGVVTAAVGAVLSTLTETAAESVAFETLSIAWAKIL